MPEIKYGDHLLHEVEDIAWDCTRTGTRRGFLIGFLIGIVAVGIGIGALVMNGAHIPFLALGPLTKGIGDTAAWQAEKEELSALRQENQALKKQAGKGAIAASCPPCKPHEAATGPSGSRAAASVSQSAKQETPRNVAAPKASVAALSSAVSQTSPPERAEAPPREILTLREVLTLKTPVSVAKAETSTPPPSLGLAIVDVRTSQGRLVPGVPIAFRFLDEGSKSIGSATVTTNASGRSTATIPTGTACAEYHLPAEYVQAGRVKPGISSATGLPLTPGMFRTCGEILAHPNGVIGVFTID
jgi:hypothetical protein